MIAFKACPRCKGDMYADRYTYGRFIACLQCGYCKDLPPPRRPRAQVQVAPQEVSYVHAA